MKLRNLAFEDTTSDEEDGKDDDGFQVAGKAHKFEQKERRRLK